MIRRLRWAVLLMISAGPSFGVDLDLSSRVDNLYWATTRQNLTAGYTFKGTDLFYNLQGSVTQELGDNLQFKGGVEIDPVLRSRAYAQLAFSLDRLSLQFAPLLGTFNSTQKWFNPGLEAVVQYTWPGLGYVRGGFLTTFAPVAKVGDYYLSSQSAAAGALFENGIVSFNIEDKAATFRTTDSMTTVDASTKYWLDTEMFLKNFPLRWAILTGFQAASRSYVTATEVTTTLYSVLLGARFSWDFGSGTAVYAQGESALFNTGWGSTVMAVPASAALFDLVAGVRYHW
jgi:hypothetical protein